MKDTIIIKQALIAEFGKSRVWSVTHGTGTARHWVKVVLLIPREFRTMKENQAFEREIEAKAEKIIKATGVELAYFPDEMTDEKHDCLSITVRTV